MKYAQLFLAIFFGTLQTVANAAPMYSITVSVGTNLCVNVVAGTNVTALGNQYGVSVLEVSPDGRYVLYNANTNANANTVYTSLGTNPAVLSREVTAATSLNGKGSTIPVFGRRVDTVSLNQPLLDLINWQPSLAASTGREIRVAILDTGLASTAGSEITNSVVAEANILDDTLTTADVANGTDSNHDGILDGEVGHGTMVASIVNLVAPQAKLIIVKVADSDGVTNQWSIYKGVKFAVDNGAKVINMSFGALERSPLMKKAIAYAEANGAVVVSGIGNNDVEEAYYPAKIPTVISVSAVNTDRTKISFSNWAKTVDVAAPGYSIGTDLLTGALGQWEGTSFSAAYVSGTIADCLRRRSSFTTDGVRKAVRKSGIKIDTSNPEYVKKLGRLLDHAALDAELGTNGG